MLARRVYVQLRNILVVLYVLCASACPSHKTETMSIWPAAWDVQDVHLLALRVLFCPLMVQAFSSVHCSGVSLGRGNIYPEQLQTLSCRQTSAVCACLIAESASQSCVCLLMASEGRLVYEGGIKTRLSGAELFKSSQKRMLKMAACLQNAARILAVLSLPLFP